MSRNQIAWYWPVFGWNPFDFAYSKFQASIRDKNFQTCSSKKVVSSLHFFLAKR